MAIVNMLPAGSSGGASITFPPSGFPCSFVPGNVSTKTTGNLLIQFRYYSGYHVGNRKLIISAGNTPSDDSHDKGVHFVPLIEFTAKYKDASGNAQTFTFEKNKTHILIYARVSGTYYFRIAKYNSTVITGSPTYVVNESGTTNRWSANDTGLLYDIEYENMTIQ